MTRFGFYKKRETKARKEAATLIVQTDANMRRPKKERTKHLPVNFATTPEQATTTWQTFSTRIGVSHLHLVPRKRSPLHEIVCFPSEIGRTKQEKKVADFHEGYWGQDVGYQRFVDCSGYHDDVQNDPLYAVHHNMHERSPILRNHRQNENLYAIRNLDLLGHGQGR